MDKESVEVHKTVAGSECTKLQTPVDTSVGGNLHCTRM